MERAKVARTVGTAITAAGLVFTAWSSQANAANRDLYHGIDVSLMRSDAGVLQAPVGSVNIDPNLFTPRVESKAGTKDKANETKNTKGTGSKSKVKGSATGTGSQSKAATKNPTAATAASNTGTKSASKEQAKPATATAATAASNTGSASASKHAEAAPENNAANNAANNNANVTTPAAPNAVAGFQSGPAMNGTQTTAGAVNGMQTNGAVAGVQSLPSTSTAELQSLAGAGLALIASGGALMIKRRRK